MARNPFRSEAEAFRFVLVTMAAFAAIAVATLLGGAWVGVPVWGVLTVGAAAFYLMQRRAVREIPTAPPHTAGVNERHILVVLDDATADQGTVGAVEDLATGHRSRVLVVCPTRVSTIDHWTSALDAGREQAQRRLEESIARLRNAGIAAQGELGDEDPLRAIEDALHTFGADAILVVTPTDEVAGATGRDVVAAARARFAVPVTRVVAVAAAAALP